MPKEPIARAQETLYSGAEEAAPTPAPVTEIWPARYERGQKLGEGGMGEVWRVWDRVLRRNLALKIIKPKLAVNAISVTRFREEAQITARLSHPGCVPVHDLGWLSDGRWWYTMEEVRGRRLRDWMDEEKAGLHRVIDLFRRACEAVGYAHAHGVIHRDLKPDNILVGDLGELRVVDWGLAKTLGNPDLVGDEPVFSSDIHTVAGTVLGTRKYMSPEQAQGDPNIGPTADVFALGVILDEILEGRTEPPELVEMCRKATQEKVEDRYRDASEFAADIGRWLEGAQQREKALRVVEGATALLPKIPALRSEAQLLWKQAKEALDRIRPWQPVADKVEAWKMEDAAAELEREAARLELEVVQQLQASFLHSPDLPEAHAALADWYQKRHAEAEIARDLQAARRNEQQLRFHDRSGKYSAWLTGDGLLTLPTDPPNAEVLLHRYTLQERRLVPVFERSLGSCPERIPLPMGSYLLVLRAPGYQELRYPVQIRRQEHWDATPPGETAPRPVCLLPSTEPEDVYVPAGWSWIGGDPEANNALPWRRLWFESFVAKRFAVTNQQYIQFLDDLVDQGREAEALRYAPRERPAKVEEEGALLYGRDDAGHFFFQADAEGDVWNPEWPVMHVDWFGARAYAQWLAARTGQPWRLPGDLEYERMARGVDGRDFPWGPTLDPTWCHMIESHRERPMLAVVDSYPVDESPWGVRGLGGNVRHWCLDLFSPQGPVIEEDRVRPPVDPGNDPALRVTRGGDWYGPDRLVRCATRSRDWPVVRVSIMGFRLVRDG